MLGLGFMVEVDARNLICDSGAFIEAEMRYSMGPQNQPICYNLQKKAPVFGALNPKS